MTKTYAQSFGQMFCFLIGVCICSTGCNKPTVSTKSLTKGKKILADAYEAHGGANYLGQTFGFTFRDKDYTFQFSEDGYTYTLQYEKDSNQITDRLTHESFVRNVNGEEAELSEKEYSRYKNGLNSVIYFASLPHKLFDPAVHVKYHGEDIVDGKAYDVLIITFEQEGGGEDHDDTYLYWINKKDKFIDYLAYYFHTGKGGVRFRSANNRRQVSGVTFQDYVNYKAPKETSLDSLTQMLENDKLQRLSEINTEGVTTL